MTTTICHPFEVAGLGIAPFRLISVTEKVYGPQNQPAGTCDYCCNGIRYCCNIQSSDGKRFIVGCDCVRKLDRADNRLIGEVEKAKRAIDREAARVKREGRFAREMGRIDGNRARLQDQHVRCMLNGMPHPMGFHNLSALDYCDFLNKNAGQSGLLKMCAVIETVQHVS